MVKKQIILSYSHLIVTMFLTPITHLCEMSATPMERNSSRTSMARTPMTRLP